MDDFHIDRVKGRLETEAVKCAFEGLLNWLIESPDLYLRPVSRGAFSAVHFSTLQDPRPYADCEFGFKGAKDHMRFWFRRPGFDSGLFRMDELKSRFADLQISTKGEAITDIRDLGEFEQVAATVRFFLERRTSRLWPIE